MSHLKTLTTPRTWHVMRKENKFITRPSQGSHSRLFALPLQIVIRDILGYVGTAREMRRMIQDTDILINGKKQKDPHANLGIFDILAIPKVGKSFRMMLSTKGRLQLQEIAAKDGATKLCKVVGKRHVTGKKIQLSFHDGHTMLTDDNSIKVGDTLVRKLPEGKVTHILKLQEGAHIFLIKGKHIGDKGILKELKGEKVIYEDSTKNSVETLKDYTVVIGDKESLI